MEVNERKIAELRIDPDTGDVVGAIYEGDKIISKRQIEESCQAIQFGKGKCYIKVFEETLGDMNLNPSEMSFVVRILKYVSYSDNMLRYKNKLLDIKTISILLDKEYECTRQIMKRLIGKGVIAKIYLTDDTKKKNYINVYVFNPFIATKGKRIPGYIFSIFQKFGWGIKQCEPYTNKPVTMAEIKDNFYANPEKSYLYILLNNSSGDIKIGVTNNIDRRLTELQTASADILYLGYISPKCDNAYELESKAHEYFSEYRKTGEWFHVNLLIAIGYIESLFDNQEITVQ